MGAMDTVSRWKITVDQYHKMGEAGIFRPDERVELIEGELIQMPPIGIEHAYRVNDLNEFFVTQLTGRAIVSVQNCVTLPPRSEPQPDIAILRRTAQRYRDRLPTSADVIVLIEVSDSSLRYDRDIKVPLYAAHGVAETWIVDVNAQQLRVYRKLVSGAYSETLTLTQDDSITPTLLPDFKINVADLLR